MTRFKHIPAILFCGFLLLSLLPGCGEKQPLSVWVSVATIVDGRAEAFANKAVYHLKKLDESFEAEITVFQEELQEGQEAAGYAETQTLLSSLLAGEGPDVIIFTDYDFGDVRKLAESGVFLDLSHYLAESDTISEGDFVPGVFTSCKVNDMYYYLPLGFNVLGAVTSREILSLYGWDTPEDIGDLLMQIDAFSAEEQSGTVFFNGFPEYEAVRDYPLRWLVQYSGIRLIDYDTGAVLPDEEALYRIISTYQKIWLQQREAEFLDGTLLAEGLLQRRELCFLYPYLNVSLIGRSVLSGDVAPEMQCLGGLDGSVVASISAYVAINANCQSPESAWRLIEMMLGKPMQDSILTGYDTTMDIPIRLGCLNDYWPEYRDYFANTYFVDSNGGNHFPEELDSETAERYAARCESAVACYNSQTALDMMMDFMTPYLAGETEYETCLEQLRNRLTLYAGE